MQLMFHAASLHDMMTKFSGGYGFSFPHGGPQFEWATLKQRRDAYIKRLNGIYGNLLQGSGVDVYSGTASFEDSNTVRVGDEMLLRVCCQCAWSSC